MSERRRSRKKTSAPVDTNKPPLLSSRQRDMALLGICPFCEQGVRGFKQREGSYDQLIENSIDPMNGHRMDCPMPEVRL
jgi:hypothetical protein